MKISVIIAAAGHGTRLKQDVPKQFIKILEKEILAYSLEVFNKINIINEIIIGTYDEKKAFEIISKFNIEKATFVTKGGSCRQETVKNAMEKASGEIILVHDAARPFITAPLVEKLIEKTLEKGAAILAVKVKDTIKVVDKDVIKETPNRDDLWAAQTPQGFRREILEKAIDFIGTDESSLVENISDVYIVESTEENFKITTEEDLRYANFLALEKSRKNSKSEVGESITIYTDGACSGNPGPGGFGAVLISGDYRKEISCGYKNTTNNRMELRAIIKALSMIKNQSEVNLFTDSKYVSDAVNKGWLYNWKNKGWTLSDGKKTQNIDLWEELLPLLEFHKVTINWVKGHAGNKENERCDFLARAGVLNPTFDD